MTFLRFLKLKSALLALVGVLSLVPAHATDKYKDVWWNPTMSGMGFNLTQIGSFLFGYWYTFEDDGSPTYFTFGGSVINNALVSPLYRSTGVPPGPGYDPAQVATEPAGQMRLDFSATNSNSAVFNYTYGAKKGAINLERFSFLDNTAALNGYFEGVTFGAGYFTSDDGSFTITAANGTIKIKRTSFFDGTCEFDGPYTLSGAAINASGTYRCSNWTEGTFTAERLRVTEEGLYIGTIFKQQKGAAQKSVELHTGIRMSN